MARRPILALLLAAAALQLLGMVWSVIFQFQGGELFYAFFIALCSLCMLECGLLQYSSTPSCLTQKGVDVSFILHCRAVTFVSPGASVRGHRSVHVFRQATATDDTMGKACDSACQRLCKGGRCHRGAVGRRQRKGHPRGQRHPLDCALPLLRPL